MSSLLITLPTLSFSQYCIKSYTAESYNQCEPIEYRLELEKVATADFSDIKLMVEFSNEVIYQENSLGLVLEQSSETTLLFNLNDLSPCDFLVGSLIVFPSCQETFINLEAEFKLINDQVCIAASTNFSVVKIPFIDVGLGQYRFVLNENQLIKEFTLKNIGRSPIQNIHVSPEIQGGFITLAETSTGSIINGAVVLDPEDLALLGYPSGSLPIQESITLTLNYNINQCALNEVRYHISFPCSQNSCDFEVLVVDENINYENSIALIPETNKLYYGLCEFEENNFSIKNISNINNSNIGDLYDLKYFINSTTINGNTINDCFDSQATVGSSLVRVISEGKELILDFSSLTIDPDGPGGLEDLDNDGIYDDLKSGESIDINFGLKVKDACAQNYHTQSYGISSSTSVRNICGATVNIPESKGYFDFAINLSGFSTSIDFKKDASNLRYVDEGDELEFRYRINYSENIDRICNSEILEFEIFVPSTTILNESKSIYHFNGTDTVTLSPKSIQGTSMKFEFPQLDSTNSTIVIPFIAVCLLEQNTNYDSSKDLCEQCLEYATPRFRTLLSKPCPTQECGIPYNFPDRISADFYTSCNDIPEVKNGLIVHNPEYYRLPPGFLDHTKTVKRNPFDTPSDINNRTYFDHDTMLVRIPFEFDCDGSQEDFRLNLNLGSMSLLEVEQLSANLNRVSPDNQNDTLKCDVSNHTSLTGRVLSFDVTKSIYPEACIMQGSKHWLDLKLLIKYTCEYMSNCGLASTRTMTLSMDEVFNNTCRRTRIISRDTIYINELYKESFGGHQFFFPRETSIYDEFDLGLSLYSTLTTSEEAPIDIRPLPIIREITYTLPAAYEPISDLNIIFENNSLSPFGFSLTEQNIISSLKPTITINNNGSKSYTYTDPATDNYTNKITSSIFSNLKIKNICEPISDFNFIEVDASIEYVDYADGTLETRIHRYQQDIPVGFRRKSFPPLDDFQINTSSLNLDWQITNNTVQSFDLLTSTIKKDDNETNIIIRYKSNGSQIDSLLIQSEDFGISTNENYEVDYLKLDNNTFEIIPSPYFIETLELDTFFLPPPLLSFTFETSNHPCGFDTLIYEIGLAKEFSDEVCAPNIFTDTLITYSPLGFPLLEIVNAPKEIDYGQESEIMFSVSNMGQGDISLTTFSFDNLPEADLTFTYLDNSGRAIDISDALNKTGSAVNINLDIVPSLAGITKDQITQHTFILKMNNICPVDPFFSTTINTEAQTHCGENITSNSSRLHQIPYINISEINYEIDHRTYVTEDYNERVYLEVLLNSLDGTASPLTNGSLQIYIPKDISFVPGSFTKNGLLVSDPRVDINDENRILILDEIDIIDGDVFEIALDLECTDRCLTQEISSYLLINKTTECNGRTSTRIINKSNPAIQELYYYPELEFKKLEIINLEIQGDIVSITPEIQLLMSGAEDRSNTAAAIIYFDTNKNNSRDADENIILQIPKSEWIVEDSIIIISSMIQLEAINMCDLSITIESPASCFNNPLLVPLSNGQNITLERQINFCNQDTVKVDLASYPTCTDGFRNLDEQNVRNNILYYPASEGVQSDVVFRDISCGSCVIIEEYHFNNSDQNINIQIENTNCTSSATVIWEDDNPIPANYTIEWNDNPALSRSEITGLISDEKLKVEITNPQGCTYVDSITVPELASITSRIESESSCDPDSLSKARVFASGVSPISITWSDGSTVFDRADLVDGIYYYILRDGNNCEYKDSVIIKKPTSIDFDMPEIQSGQLGTTVELNPQNIDNENWTWSWGSTAALSCNDCSTPSFVLSELTTISLILSNGDCTLEQNTTIEPTYSDDYYSPNIFAPKSTNNKRFLIFPNASYDYYDLMILDRWGNIVYDKTIDNWQEDNVGWDGTFRGQDVASGVYMYRIKLNREADSKEVNYVGEFILIR